jgi:hypothetical protein
MSTSPTDLAAGSAILRRQRWPCQERELQGAVPAAIGPSRAANNGTEYGPYPTGTCSHSSSGRSGLIVGGTVMPGRGTSGLAKSAQLL